jgi:deoxyribonuclease-4
MALLGAHESVAGGLHLAFERILKVGGESLQIFSRNQRQWTPPPLRDEEVDLFKAAREKAGDMIVASHGSYLVNLAANKKEVLEKSVVNFSLELERCGRLGIPYVVLHPGSHGGDGVEAGLERFVRGLDRAIERGGQQVMVLAETTAGQGTSLGAGFEELAYILGNTRYPELVGVCVDTCHIFAAGYELRTAEGYAATMASLEEQIGLGKVKLFHVNDSKKPLGSRVDRHEHIGKGEIGLDGFRHLMRDARFAHLPMTLETPKGESLAEDVKNLAVLRSLYLDGPSEKI